MIFLNSIVVLGGDVLTTTGSHNMVGVKLVIYSGSPRAVARVDTRRRTTARAVASRAHPFRPVISWYLHIFLFHSLFLVFFFLCLHLSCSFSSSSSSSFSFFFFYAASLRFLLLRLVISYTWAGVCVILFVLCVCVLRV